MSSWKDGAVKLKIIILIVLPTQRSSANYER